MPQPEPAPVWGGLSEGDVVVVDTAPLIYILENHRQFASKFVGLFEDAESGRIAVAISAISVAEVLVDPLKAGRDALAKRYEKALSGFDLIPVSTEISVTAARLRANIGLRLRDAILAATALEIEAAALVTHDRDFSTLEGLKVLTGA